MKKRKLGKQRAATVELTPDDLSEIDEAAQRSLCKGPVTPGS